MTVYLNKFKNYKIQINLKGGEVYFGEKPALVYTVLGSCLAIVFYSRRHNTGAIAHAQLPEQECRGLHCSTACPIKCRKEAPDANIYKYVSCSLYNMDKKFDRLGIKKREIEVKIFGGANVIHYERKLSTIGEQNIEVALKLINECRLNLVSHDVGGNIGRTIYFCTDTGDVFLRRHKEASRFV